MSRWKQFFLGVFVFASGSLSANSLTQFLFSGCDICANPSAPMRSFSGFYVGLAGGVATNMAETSLFTNVLTVADDSETYLAENNVYQIRGWGEVYGGWGWQICWLYLGGRIGGNFSTFDPEATYEAQVIDDDAGLFFDVQNNSLKTELRVAEFTADFKPGIVFWDNTMFFGIFGAAFNKEHMHGRALYSDLVNDFSTEIEVTKRRSFAGFRGGVGIEHLFCGCLSLNIMYIYTRYWELNESTTLTTLTPLDIFYTATFSTRAQKQVTSIGLTYYF